MTKIHILGGSGSGKTTLAQQIACRLQIPHYDLDKVNWHQNSPVAIAEEAAWVTEGVYLIVTEAMLYHADYIVVLTGFWPVQAWRIVQRHILNSLRHTQPYPGINGIKALFKLLQYVWSYNLNLSEKGKEIPPVQHLYAFIEEHAMIANPPTQEFIDKYAATYSALTVAPTRQFLVEYLTRYQEKVITINNNADRDRFLAMITQKRCVLPSEV